MGWMGVSSGGVGKSPRIFPEVSENCRGLRKLQRDIIQRQNTISKYGLYRNDSMHTIMTGSPVEYVSKK